MIFFVLQKNENFFFKNYKTIVFEKALNLDFAYGISVIFKHGGTQEELKSGTSFFTYKELYRDISLMNRVFANGPGDRGSILGHVIRKKWYLMSSCLTLSIIG